MSNFLVPHPPASIEQMRAAVLAWRQSAEHERFRVANNLCSGDTTVARHNAALYERIAQEIQREIAAREAEDSALARAEGGE